MIRLLICFIMLIFTICYAHAWPEKTITMIVPLAPGNGTDIVGRILAEELSNKFKVKVIVENRVGASTTIGTNHVINSPADGYTLLFTSPSLVGAIHTLKSTKYKIEKDLIPITIVAETPFVLAVSSTKFKSVKDLIEYGVKNEVSYGTIGYGGSTHFASAQFADVTGIKTIAIPYKGTQDSLTDLMMDRVEFMFTPMQATTPLYDGGKINILGVISKNRSKILVTVPTFKELGLSSVNLNFWVGLFVAKNTNQDIVKILSDAVEEIKQSKSFINKIETIGAESYEPMTNKQFLDFLKEENDTYMMLKTKTGIEAQ